MENTQDTKRLNLVLTIDGYRELMELAHSRRESMTQVIRIGLGFVKLAIQAKRDGHKMTISDANNEVIKEIILP